MVFYTQADRLLEKKGETVAYTLAEINAKVLFKKTANIVAVVKVKTRKDKLVIAADKALVDTLANILERNRYRHLARDWLRCRPRRFWTQ